MTFGCWFGMRAHELMACLLKQEKEPEEVAQEYPTIDAARRDLEKWRHRFPPVDPFIEEKRGVAVLALIAGLPFAVGTGAVGGAAAVLLLSVGSWVVYGLDCIALWVPSWLRLIQLLVFILSVLVACGVSFACWFVCAVMISFGLQWFFERWARTRLVAGILGLMAGLVAAGGGIYAMQALLEVSVLPFGLADEVTKAQEWPPWGTFLLMLSFFVFSLYAVGEGLRCGWYLLPRRFCHICGSQLRACGHSAVNLGYAVSSSAAHVLVQRTGASGVLPPNMELTLPPQTDDSNHVFIHIWECPSCGRGLCEGFAVFDGVARTEHRSKHIYARWRCLSCACDRSLARSLREQL